MRNPQAARQPPDIARLLRGARAQAVVDGDRKEPRAAYVADALVALATGTSPLTKPVETRLNVSYEAVKRGYVEPGEVCELVGIGPIPVALARSLLNDARVTVMPASTSADEVLAQKPDGIFLSNGPGDPAATGRFAVPEIKKLVASGKPLFGICLGHQMLALALGGRTEKMKFGHHGANHPVKDLTTGKVEITSQNHGFAVRPESLPDAVRPTHISLFDGSLEGLRVKNRPVFSVQYHPEASPGPQDSAYLFERFLELIESA